MKLFKWARLFGLFPIVLLSGIGCASYQTRVKDAHSFIRQGESAKAADFLKERAYKDGNDQLVFLLDYATANQIAQNYQESNKAFLLAEELTDIKDYHSLSRITGSLLVSEELMQYKGDDYEKVLINAMTAVNFLMLGDLEAAMVETRKLNTKLHRFKTEAKRNYDQSPLAFYLSALIREQDKDWDGAYIDFKRTLETNPKFPYLGNDLLLAARRAGRSEDIAKWKKQFPNAKENPSAKDKRYGEIVLILQQGWGPKKQPHPSWARIPKLYPTASTTRRARLEVIDGPSEDTNDLFSVEDVAIKTLDDQYAGLIAKRVAAVAAKAVVSDQVRQKNQLLGDLTWIGMNLVDRADLRQWSTLPQTFQIAKVWLKAGRYKVKIQGLGFNGEPDGENLGELEVEVKPQQKTFILRRSVK